MYTTSKNWERTFYLTTWLVQGSSFLVPRAYGVMHRMHHTYSDTAEDPHSPVHLGVFGVAMGQLRSYEKVIRGLIKKQEP